MCCNIISLALCQYLSDADLELEGLVPVERRVELGSVFKRAGVVHC